jgi:hypothetical protein
MLAKSGLIMTCARGGRAKAPPDKVLGESSLKVSLARWVPFERRRPILIAIFLRLRASGVQDRQETSRISCGPGRILDGTIRR